MARKRGPLERKLRTREHILADLAVNHVERQILLCGWSVERIQRDYGIDLILFTYTDQGEAEPGLIFLQVKSTEQLTWLRSGQHAAFRLDRGDLVGWLQETIPILLVAYEATTDRAYWLYVQQHFAALPTFDVYQAGQTITVHLPATQSLDPAAVCQFALFRNQAAEVTNEE